MKTKKAFRAVFSLALLACLIYVGIDRLRNLEPEHHDLFEYRSINREHEIPWSIVNRSMVYKGTSFIVLTNGAKISLKRTRNFDYEPSFLGAFLQSQDSISKGIGSDTIWVTRRNEQFIFISGQYLNEPVK